MAQGEAMGTVTGLPCIDWRKTRAVAVRDRAEFRNEVTVLVQDAWRRARTVAVRDQVAFRNEVTI